MCISSALVLLRVLQGSPFCYALHNVVMIQRRAPPLHAPPQLHLAAPPAPTAAPATSAHTQWLERSPAHARVISLACVGGCMASLDALPCWDRDARHPYRTRKQHRPRPGQVFHSRKNTALGPTKPPSPSYEACLARSERTVRITRHHPSSILRHLCVATAHCA